MDVSRFELDGAGQQRVIKNVKCGLCQNVIINPHTCGSNHPFCKSCIFQHLDRENTCPVDSAPLTKEDVKYSLMHDDMLAIFTVRCGNQRGARSSLKAMQHRLACPWKGSVSDLRSHELECSYRRQQCEKCGESFLSVYIRAHELHCPKRSVECDLCGTSVNMADMKSHYDSCPESSVYCPNHCQVEPDTGQVTILRRKDVTAHMSICPNRIRECKFTPFGCKFRGTMESLKSHLNSTVCDHLSILAESQVSILQTMRLVESKLSSLPTLPTPERRQRSPSPIKCPVSDSSPSGTRRLTRSQRLTNKDSKDDINGGLGLGKRTRFDDDCDENVESIGRRRKSRNHSVTDRIKTISNPKSVLVSAKPPDKER